MAPWLLFPRRLCGQTLSAPSLGGRPGSRNPGMLAGKPRPLSGRSGARAPLGARGPLQPLAGATSKPNDSGDEAQRSAEALATLETAQRPCVQGPGLAWGTLAPPPPSAPSSPRGPVWQRWGPWPSARCSVPQTHMAQGAGKDRELLRGQATRVLSAWGSLGVGQQPNRLRPVLRPRLSLGTTPPPRSPRKGCFPKLREGI